MQGKFSQTFYCASEIERSFSKMKIVNNYLRSTMKGERLEDLIVLPTEKDITDTIDLNVVLKSWATLNYSELYVSNLSQTAYEVC